VYFCEFSIFYGSFKPPSIWSGLFGSYKTHQIIQLHITIKVTTVFYKTVKIIQKKAVKKFKFPPIYQSISIDQFPKKYTPKNSKEIWLIEKYFVRKRDHFYHETNAIIQIKLFTANNDTVIAYVRNLYVIVFYWSIVMSFWCFLGVLKYHGWFDCDFWWAGEIWEYVLQYWKLLWNFVGNHKNFASF
jgi:hypothetical protein